MDIKKMALQRIEDLIEALRTISPKDYNYQFVSELIELNKKIASLKDK